jgi:hypothetical protein
MGHNQTAVAARSQRGPAPSHNDRAMIWAGLGATSPRQVPRIWPAPIGGETEKVQLGVCAEPLLAVIVSTAVNAETRTINGFIRAPFR